MLTVYSTPGSPGASTTAMHLAAHWASTGREVLLIEADPAGGSLSHNLGIQFTPGSASFVASGLPVLRSHLIDHAQDVLFEKLHVMPAPASPAGAHGIFRTFADSSEDLRTISENGMAVIVDGGRITAETVTSGLTTAAAGVVVVCRGDSSLSSLELLKDVLVAGPDADGPADGPRGCAVTIDKSPMDDDLWRQSYGLAFCGAIDHVAGMTADLSAHLNRNKRKSKKWRISLEQAAEKLYRYAQPPASESSRLLRPGVQAPLPGTEQADDAEWEAPAPTAPVPDPSFAQDPAGYGQTPPTPEPQPQPSYTQPHDPPPTPQSQPHDPPPTPQSQPHYPQPQPGHTQPHYPPPQPHHPQPQPGYPQPQPGYPQPQPGHTQPHYPPPQPHHPQPQPGYPQPQPGHTESHYLPPQPGQPQPQPGQPQPQPGQPQPHYPQPQPGHTESHYLPPTGWLDDPPGYGQPLPTMPPAGQPAHRQTPPPPYRPAEYPGHLYEQPQPGAYAPTQYPAPSYGQPAAQPPPPTRGPAYEQASPVPAGQTIPAAQEPEVESPPAPDIQPTGSFRDWAAKLHGSDADDTAAQDRGT